MMNANSPAVTLAQAAGVAAATPHPPPPAPTTTAAHVAPSTPNSAPAAPAVAGPAAALTLTPASVVPPPNMPVPLPATPATPATPSAAAPGAATPAKHTRGPKAFWNHGRDLILFAGLQQLKLDGNLADSDLPKPAGYEQLAARINQEWGPPAVSVEQVRNRIKNLRAQYFRALRVLATPGVVGFNRQTAMIEAPMAVWEQLNGIDARLAKFRDTSLEWLPLAQTMWPVAPGEVTAPTTAAAAAAAAAASASASASGTPAPTAAPSLAPAIAPRVPTPGHHRTPRYTSSRAAAASSGMTPPPPLAPAAVSPPPPALPPPSPSPPLHTTLPPPPSSSAHHGPPPAKRPRTDDDAAFLGALSGLVTTFKEVHGGAAPSAAATHVPPAPPAPAKIDDVDLAMAHINHHYSVDAQVGAAVLFMDNKTAASMYLKLTDAARAPFLARILKLDVSVIRRA
ncbi:hypothetical protein AMAG_10567 [Allomyces macrogynus ATCC 38327]|uniref:Myb/SANT-like domain-containing protein n=1 Tax=Allomyces macrogynus (strain ATCC 38327) TaxID=578462 RepID=A0A0L0SQX5_ALLM3|nr:hypothetical protein AMAG_10567 [Allomyces macrogynus ATCC 38327]|eukprot:KNE64901.1 hypothetical protein AMAG_10567 [Allomyces macrogynus ATCC 38327]